MSEFSAPPSPSRAVVALLQPVDHEWQPVFHVSNQVVLYNPKSHALSIRQSNNFPVHSHKPCPYCKQTLPDDFEPPAVDEDIDTLDSDPAYHSRASDYFQLLAIANETSSRPSTPPPPSQEQKSAFPAEKMAEGYFKAFFQEEYKLGMGANGSVFLCQFSSFGPKVPTLHVLMQWAEGGSLDDFIDVRLGRPAQHVHIDPLGQFSFGQTSSHISSADTASGPSTPILTYPQGSPNTMAEPPLVDSQSRSARIRAFRQFQHASPAERERIRHQMQGARAKGRATTLKAVHLLSAEEVKSLFEDVVAGLGFLHNKSILHLDLKPGNVLLTWDEGKLIPRAMLSDFGTSRDMLQSSRSRSGNTGTLEYTSPESLPSPHTGLLQQIDSKADMWSLGMILHKLLFFRLPYRYAAAGDAISDSEPLSAQRESDKLAKLEREVLEYPGFKSTSTLVTAFEARRLPRSFLVLLESLLNIIPSGRPSCERVANAIKDGKLDPLKDDFLHANGSVTLRRPEPILAGVEESKPNAVLSTEDITQTAISDMDEEPPTPKMVSPQTPVSPTFAATEKTQLLGPPTPSPPPIPDILARNIVESRLGLLPLIHIPASVWERALKSCVLVAKVRFRL
ncbi:hypothetical protein H0H81_008650 [Sphagnurus paluster]|uniref:Protein kinase domain-containing protein n=1 Tax=Sphagnurus paluster TaxID=117069 RepID=A0A9P7FW96_9AGAR|nr:hypothetical protein H0H81_008650 [Sphagnurus paluster]